MNRRNFLKKGSAAGIAITSLGLGSCQSPEAPAKDQVDISKGQDLDDFELNEITIDELQKKMQAGTYTSRSVT
jgi:amidase